uniref:Myb/SANT-like domain-containing protein n=1 Tax=Chenopodium quinoa TaxID=63459 RepID=A0A803N0M3_CHEQI
MGKMHWDARTSTKYLEMLIQEKDAGGHNKWNWELVTKQLSACINKEVNSRQCENRLFVLKGHYKSHVRLSNMTGLVRDPITNKVDVEKENDTERWHKFLADFPKCGYAIVTKGLANAELMEQIFQGTTAIGVGGCFSPAMARGKSILSKKLVSLSTNDDNDEFGYVAEEGDDDVDPSEGSGDNENIDSDYVGIDLNVSNAAQSVSPPKTVRTKLQGGTSIKRKSEGSIDTFEEKIRRASIDNVIKLLEKSVASKPMDIFPLVIQTLSRMGVVVARGQHYYIRAVKYLEEEKFAHMFLALEDDEARW